VLLPDGTIYGSCRDITERKRAEHALKESESNLQERVKELNGTFSLGQLAENSEKLEEIFTEFVNIIVPQSMQFSEHVFVSLEIMENRYCNLENYALSKSQIHLSAPINLHEIETGRLIVAYTEDLQFIDYYEKKIVNNFASRISRIIERVKIKQALEKSEKRLHQLNNDKDRFISILGHDLKSPFNNILGLSELLIEEIHTLKRNEIGEIANNIYKSAKTTNNLLEDILMWARSQQDTLPFSPQILSLSEICINILDILNPIAFSKNITIYNLVGEKMSVYADPNHLKTIILNLVSNAIKFTNTNGEINISAESDADKVIVSVSDNGIGIPHKDIIKLFDISVILSTRGTSGETGTGLGLLLCKEFVEKHNGKIWVESEVGKGSTFKFSLPLFNDHDISRKN
jgi:signal transduction histidine kinase